MCKLLSINGVCSYSMMLQLRLLCRSFWHCRGYHECVCCRCLYNFFYYYLSLVEAWEWGWKVSPFEKVAEPEAACHYYKN